MDVPFRDVLKKAMTSFFGRIVLALYTLLVVPLMPSIINFTNNILGYNLTDLQVSAYANKASLAIGGLAAIWLLNNGLFERAAVKAKAILDASGEADVPPKGYIKGP